ncbi:MAG: hypothetical protein ABSA67_00660 [Candidatus Brocadiia bacterium]
MAVMLGVALPVVFGGLIVGIARSACAQPAAPTVEVRGICVTGAPYGIGTEKLASLFAKGTTLTLLVTVPQGGLFAVDDEKTHLVKFADDKGTDLRGSTVELIGETFDTPQISTDGTACLVELNGPGLPAKDATAIMASGCISLKCGSRKETARNENAALKPGTKVAANRITFEISEVSKPQFSYGFSQASGAPSATPPTEQLEVTLSTDQDCSSIASITFFDAAGKDLGARLVSSSWVRMAGMKSGAESFVLSKKVDTATISITYWADVKEVLVPFDVKATLGL